MKEDFLHFLWQYQHFESSNLKSTDNESIILIKRGFWNQNSGPDFQDARLLIGEIEWAGNVEIHLKSSDWLRHNHQKDAAYHNVILHVVWEHDKVILNANGKPIPTLQLSDFADKKLLNRYRNLLQNQGSIACENDFKTIDEIKKLAMLDRSLMRRLERKAGLILDRVRQNKGDWEESTFQILAGNFGFKLNSEAFIRLAENTPFKLLKKYAHSAKQIEALLFGVAGFLKRNEDAYALELAKEFNFLSTKHQLVGLTLDASQWRFLRTRPANFPTVRLCQLAALLEKNQSFFSVFTETQNFKDLIRFLDSSPSDYWKKHYDFGKESTHELKGIGKASIQNIIVNTVVPILVAYGIYTDEQKYTDRAIQFLEAIPAEKNHITSFWKSLDLPIKNMSDSQGSIELYNEFCQNRACLGCGIGLAVLGKK